ncbi:MAG: formylglycine-generating enzyme family protein, partial [Cyanobacteria bacterium P01_H01_bin.15]
MYQQIDKSLTNVERPQHQVSVSEFFLGKYPVTQAQWRVVAALLKVKRDLKPKPSNFKGDDLPVEQVSWWDAAEFCDRLSSKTSRDYRLPSEAEWEYACRAGTTTPFYFGATISPEIANYRCNYSYAKGSKGEYREKTTEVGNFPPNSFGLFDMHGNVWEWCLGHWYQSYNGAPTNSSHRLSDDENPRRVIRGGSWLDIPDNCRSACRINYSPGVDNSIVGFRVVCGAPR